MNKRAKLAQLHNE